MLLLLLLLVLLFLLLFLSSSPSTFFRTSHVFCWSGTARLRGTQEIWHVDNVLRGLSSTWFVRTHSRPIFTKDLV
jgi:hypothetical protein